MLRKQTTRLVSAFMKVRLGLMVACSLLACVSAILFLPSSAARISSPPAENACVPPGVTVVTDAANDQTAGVSGGTTSHDLIAVSLAEQYPAGAAQLVVTMKVASLS